jgi:hypothetical protein
LNPDPDTDPDPAFQVNPDPEMDPDPGFGDQKMKKKILLKTSFFTYPYASIKDVQATGEAFSPQKRTSSNSKNKISNFFLCLWVIFALVDPDPDTDPGTPLNPDPQHWMVRYAAYLSFSPSTAKYIGSWLCCRPKFPYSVLGHLI